MEQSFDYLRSVYVLILLFALINLFLLVFLNNKVSSIFIAMFNTFFLFFIAFIMAFRSGEMIDEFGLSGGNYVFYFTLAVGIIFSISFIVYLILKPAEPKK